MDSEKITILGQDHSTRTTPGNVIQNIMDNAQRKNEFLEYGNDSKEWRKKEYNITRRMLQQVRRNERLNEMRKALNMPLLGGI